jgi:hypothetical protein
MNPHSRDYVQRAYDAVEGEEDREKLEGYIRQRIDPLIRSGAVHAVNWATEPLPHTLGFTIKTGGWIPASKVKEQFERQVSPQKAAKMGNKKEELPKPGLWSLGNNLPTASGTAMVVDEVIRVNLVYFE